MTSRFAADTAVTPSGEGCYRADIDRGWWIIRGPNGGYLAAIVVRAIEAEVDAPDQRLRSLTLHYLRAPQEGPCEIEVTVERRGRTLTSVSVRVCQQHEVIIVGLAATAADRDGPAFADLPLPAVPAPPEQPPPPAPLPPEQPPIPMRDRYQMHTVLGPDRASDELAGEALTGGWIRLAEPEPIDAAVVAALADAWTPAIFTRAAGPLGVPTVDLTIHFRDQPEPRHDWSFVRFRSRHASGGYVEEDGEVWSRDGRLLAQSRQLAVELPVTVLDSRPLA